MRTNKFTPITPNKPSVRDVTQAAMDDFLASGGTITKCPTKKKPERVDRDKKFLKRAREAAKKELQS